MTLGVEFVDAHIALWQQKLASHVYEHRKHWPAHLFHHAPIENAVAILRDGHLRSRNETVSIRPKDVAAPGVIDVRDHAHSRVRLYFRPKTPTQWHIEGIRKTGECSYGDGTHAAVLVMFALDARMILAQHDIMFSNKNMQLAATIPGNDADYFSSIPFDKVFSEGGTGGDRSIIDARCAEVLPTSPLALHNCLRGIYFRSEPERDTLLYMLGNDRPKWERFCYVSDALRTFQKAYTFVQELRLTNEGVVFRLNPRSDQKCIDIKIEIWDDSGAKIANFFKADHAPYPNPPAISWIWKRKLADGIYRVEVRLEDCLAYASEVILGNTLF